MLKQAFCGTCMRTLYLSSEDDEACPVCSSPLAMMSGTIEEPEATTPVSELIPANEDLRLAAVGRYGILDTPADGAFDRITSLAAKIFSVPISTITIVDRDRIWFKSRYGIDAEEIGRDPGLCASAVLNHEVFEVTDARIDPRTLDNPLVRGELGLRFYAAAPLTTADGYGLGTINIIDTEPRELTEDQRETLVELAELVVDAMELRLAAVRLYREAEEKGVALAV